MGAMATRRPPLVLLPPSEGKLAPARGRPLDLAALSFPPLTPLRESLLDDALRRVHYIIVEYPVAHPRLDAEDMIGNEPRLGMTDIEIFDDRGGLD